MQALARLRLASVRFAVVFGTGLAGSLAGWTVGAPFVPAGSAHEVDRLLIVDCLLPGQVRRLGTALTDLTPRRPLKLNADECALRGGEYVAYDRADLATAPAVWLPLAEGGDAQAQTHAGELYERGIGGVAPDYSRAAQWYGKAAAQGHARARINLGFLHEKGLGVAKDPLAALRMYRPAAGVDGAIALDDGGPAVSAERAAQLEALRRELEETRRQLDEARDQLRRQQGARRSEFERLERERSAARASGNVEARYQVEQKPEYAPLKFAGHEAGDFIFVPAGS